MMDALQALRQQMPVCNDTTYLDCAYDCGGSVFAAAAAQQYFTDWTKAAALCERGGPGRKTFFELADETRSMICTLIGAQDPRGVAFTRNTNEGVSHILMGFNDWQKEDNIVVCSIEHPSVLMPALNAAKLKNIECRVIEPAGGEYLPFEIFEKVCDDHTRMVLVSHVQSGNGVKTDLAKLGAFCKAHGIYLIVDAIQSLGFNKFEAEAWGVSAVTAGAYKGLLASESCAFLWASADLLSHIWPVYTAAGMAMTVDRSGAAPTLKCTDPTWARKLENSSLDAPGIYMLHAGISKVLEIGMDVIEPHIRRMYERLWEGLAALGISPVTPRDYDASCASIAFTLPDQADFFRFMMERKIVLTNSRLLRLSLGAFNTAEDVETCLSAIKEYLNQ